MITDRRAIIQTLVVGSLFAALPAHAAGDEQEIVDKARKTVTKFTGDADMRWLRNNVGRAKGVLVIPMLVKAGFILGGSGGSGVLLARNSTGWSYPAFYTMGSGTFGLQIGAEAAQIMLVVMTTNGMDALLSTDVKLGGDVSITAGPVGVGAKAETADVLAFSRTKGLYGGLNVEGAVIATRKEWNKEYYGRAITPREILFEGKGVNHGADALRKALSQTVS